MDNSRKGKKNKIRPGYGINDYYKHYIKEFGSISKYNLEKSIFRDILTDFHSLIVHEIVFNNYEFTLPQRMGTIFMRKFKPTLKIQDGTLINHNPPDWKKTKELWDKDPEAREKKILVRHLNKHTRGYIFLIKYSTSKANFKNKSVYTFTPVRQVDQLITKATKEYNIDTFIL